MTILLNYRVLLQLLLLLTSVNLMWFSLFGGVTVVAHLIVINFRVTFVTFGVASIDAQVVAETEAEAAAARECRWWRLIDDPKRPAVVLLDLQLARPLPPPLKGTNFKTDIYTITEHNIIPPPAEGFDIFI